MKKDDNKHITVEIGHRPTLPMGKMVQRNGAAIVMVTGGKATIELNFSRYTIAVRHLLFLAPLSTLRFVECSDDFTLSYVFFTPAVAEAITTGLDPTLFALITQFPVAEIRPDDEIFLTQLMAGVRHVIDHSNGEHRMQIAQNMLQCFYLELYDRTKDRFAPKANAVSSQENIFVRFVALVQQYAATERDIAFYADHLCICNRYLSGVVRRQTGKTAKDFIDGRCLQEIKRRLLSTQDSLQAIALQMHFPDQSFFSRYFKKLSGMTPTQFRASMR